MHLIYCPFKFRSLWQFRKEASEISWHKWNVAVAVSVAIVVVVAALVTQASKCLDLYMNRIRFVSDGERPLAVPRPPSDICSCCCCCLLHLQNLCVRIFSRHAKGKLILFTLQLRLIFLHFSVSWERKEKPRAALSCLELRLKKCFLIWHILHFKLRWQLPPKCLLCKYSNSNNNGIEGAWALACGCWARELWLWLGMWLWLWLWTVRMLRRVCRFVISSRWQGDAGKSMASSDYSRACCQLVCQICMLQHVVAAVAASFN